MSNVVSIDIEVFGPKEQSKGLIALIAQLIEQFDFRLPLGQKCTLNEFISEFELAPNEWVFSLYDVALNNDRLCLSHIKLQSAGFPDAMITIVEGSKDNFFEYRIRNGEVCFEKSDVAQNDSFSPSETEFTLDADFAF